MMQTTLLAHGACIASLRISWNVYDRTTITHTSVRSLLGHGVGLNSCMAMQCYGVMVYAGVDEDGDADADHSDFYDC